MFIAKTALSYNLCKNNTITFFFDLPLLKFPFLLGVALLSNIKDFGKISTKFPNDINIISHGASLLFVTLESNGTNPENQLSNDLVLFKYSVSKF